MKMVTGGLCVLLFALTTHGHAPHVRLVVRELVIPSTPEHFAYHRPGGAGWNICSAWNGPCDAAIQSVADLLSCGSYAHSLVGL